ncbi:MAG: hypothetical protein DRG59_01340 [Deltaproteobacteria bacterium]|nr:MAG: hypothetical protein DRG59_01340 [Deltaproteobacteria bacterium]HEC30859.1 hypothetical protein [Deltaproteobacteria bacterium]
MKAMVREANNAGKKEYGTEDKNLLILEEIIGLQRSKRKETRKDQVPEFSTLVGTCLDAKHPALQGRVLVEWKIKSGESYRKWIPTLMGVTVRKCDRVLLSAPGNWTEPVVIGVLDGFALRPPKEKIERASLELERDESITVYAANGEKILEVFYEGSGPVVKLMKEDVEVEMPGKLRLSAKSVNIEAKTGGVKIKASDDVKIEGEVIKLN